VRGVYQWRSGLFGSNSERVTKNVNGMNIKQAGRGGKPDDGDGVGMVVIGDGRTH